MDYFVTSHPQHYSHNATQLQTEGLQILLLLCQQGLM